MTDLGWDDRDLVSVADFAEAVWSAERTELPAGDDDALKSWLAAKQASIRMLRRNNPGFPEAKGSDGRTALYAMDDLTRWWHSAHSKRAPDEPAPDALWSLRRAV